jgi:hypothetical protein
MVAMALPLRRTSHAVAKKEQPSVSDAEIGLRKHFKGCGAGCNELAGSFAYST